MKRLSLQRFNQAKLALDKADQMGENGKEGRETQQIDGYAAYVDKRNQTVIGQSFVYVAFRKFVNLVVLPVSHTPNITPPVSFVNGI